MTQHTTTTTAAADGVTTPPDDDGFPAFRDLVARRSAGPGPYFTTSARGLYGLFLANLPANHQTYECRACREFVDRYGGLVWIDKNGVTQPVFWPGPSAGLAVPEFFRQANHCLHQAAAGARVTGVFLSGEASFGRHATEDRKRGCVWTHLWAPNPAPFNERVLTAEQAAAQKRQDYLILVRALRKYPRAAVAEAARVLDLGALYRTEKVAERVRWFLALAELYERVVGTRDAAAKAAFRNRLWLAVATAPPGFCHVTANVENTLYDDILSGAGFDAVPRRWSEKLHPLQYRRPQAPPAAGTIKQAEGLFEKLGAAGALKRRFATLADVTAVVTPLWVPRPEAPAGPTAGGGVFDHLRRAGAAGAPVKPLETPARPVTWARFAREVLPGADRLEVWLGPGRHPLFGLCTAADPAAPPVLQWDGLVERDSDPHGMATPLPRNPVAWYFEHGGSFPDRFGLTPGLWYEVLAAVPKPCHWQRPDQFRHHPRAAFLVLKGAADAGYRGNGGLFAECLRAEFHGARAVLEAHFAGEGGAVAGARPEDGPACGVAVCEDAPCPLTVRVRRAGGPWESYVIDRYE